jgi:FkbM family methyltransferase
MGRYDSVSYKLMDFIKTRPYLFDIAKRVYRTLPSKKDDTYKFFANVSKSRSRHVTFVQIGASDGLRWDPIREHIVRDGWKGILVEPLPTIFEVLKYNYAYIHKPELTFVNAAISSQSGNRAFWTLDDGFLSELSLQERIIYSQKSSFNEEHVRRWIRLNGHQDNIIKKIDIPCITLSELIVNHWDLRPITLLVIDTEGHEASIIKSIDFNIINPEIIYFESHNLGARKLEVYDFLSKHYYDLKEFGGDTIASRTTVRHLRQ